MNQHNPHRFKYLLESMNKTNDKWVKPAITPQNLKFN